MIRIPQARHLEHEEIKFATQSLNTRDLAIEFLIGNCSASKPQVGVALEVRAVN